MPGWDPEPQDQDWLPPALTLDELKIRLDFKSDDEDKNAELLDYLRGAFQTAMLPAPYGTGRRLMPYPEEDGDDEVTLRLPMVGRRVLVPDARIISAVTGFDGETSYPLVLGDIAVVERNAHIIQLALPTPAHWPSGWATVPGGRRYTAVEATGRFGFADVPRPLAEAIYTLAGRMWHERDAQYSDVARDYEGAPAYAYYRTLPARTKLAFKAYTLPASYAGLG